MKNLKNNLAQVAHLSGAVTVGIVIAYIDLSVKTLAIVASFTAALWFAYAYLEEKEYASDTPIADQVAAAQGFDLSSLDKRDRGE
jgi:ribose/xylose/arabinose/galactoside ABC-type transport system permease subunit